MDKFRVLYSTHPNSQFIHRFYALAEQTFLDSISRYQILTFTPEMLAVFCVGSLKHIEELWIFGKIKKSLVEFALIVQKVIITILHCEN
jgi:hypothetical protein